VNSKVAMENCPCLSIGNTCTSMSVTHVYWNMRVVRVSYPKIASAFLLIPNAEQKFYDPFYKEESLIGS